MDAKRFDRLTMTLSTAGTRRGALGALRGGTLSLLGLAETAAGRQRHRGDGQERQGQRRSRATRSKTKNRREGARGQGPCGDGSGKANTCDRDGQCCTGYCKKSIGRCRCRKLGQGCEEDRNCCATSGQPMTCQSGSCQMVQAVQAPLSPPPPDAPPPSPPPPPPPPFCATNPSGTVCQGSGTTALRCCAGACPAQPTCLPGGSPCADGPTCDAQCCSQSNTFVFPGEFFICSLNRPGEDPNPCATDADCESGIEESPAWCVCQKCCLSPGTDVDGVRNTCDTCCNGCAPGNTTCA